MDLQDLWISPAGRERGQRRRTTSFLVTVPRGVALLFHEFAGAGLAVGGADGEEVGAGGQG